jgi:hypothetical protein
VFVERWATVSSVPPVAIPYHIVIRPSISLTRARATAALRPVVPALEVLGPRIGFGVMVDRGEDAMAAAAPMTAPHHSYLPTRRRTAAIGALASCSPCHHVRLHDTADGSKSHEVDASSPGHGAQGAADGLHASVSALPLMLEGTGEEGTSAFTASQSYAATGMKPPRGSAAMTTAPRNWSGGPGFRR